MSAEAQPAPVWRMISAAFVQFEPAQPVCSRALCSVWSRMTGDQAFMYWIAFCARALLPVKYQRSACAYAAAASSRSSVQPLLGFEYAPHSTIARGAGLRESEASECELS